MASLNDRGLAHVRRQRFAGGGGWGLSFSGVVAKSRVSNSRERYVQPLRLQGVLTMLEEIAAEIRGCRKCRLWQSRTHAVPGEGPADAHIMFIGEGPGREEDLQGRPFVGPAGQLLNELLAEAGLRRDEVFITNIVKCRPPDNREPLPDEVAACRDYLNGQIAVINPKVICTLGRPALHALVDPGLSITKEHGQPRQVSGIVVVPLYHPAAALHRQDLRPQLVADMAKLRLILDRVLCQR